MYRFSSLLCLFSLITLVRGVDPSVNETLQNKVIEALGECICVKHFQCDDDGFIITNGENLITIKLNEDEKRPVCKGGKFVGELLCCKLRSESTTDTTAGPIDNKGPVKKLLCGNQRPLITLRVFSGEDELIAMDGEFPWMAAIFTQDTPGSAYTYKSGGSMIHPQMILTVNHHYEDTKPGNLKVIVNGRIKLPAIGENPLQERSVQEIVHHPSYSHGSVYFDAAILILDKPFDINQTKFINRICLPPPGVELNKLKCVVAGWGSAKESQNGAVMKKVELPYVPNDKCEKLLQDTDLGSFFKLHKSFICAGGEAGKDACKGDGGGPLMCPFPTANRYYQIGIVSWGVGCGEANVPGVYTSVPMIRDWIENEIKSRNFT